MSAREQRVCRRCSMGDSLKILWSAANIVGVRNLGGAVRRIFGQYHDTLFQFYASEHPAVEGCLALTIDDGLCRSEADCSLVREVLDLLQTHNAKATFFVCSKYLAGSEEGAASLLEDGHEFGNHMTEDRGDYWNLPDGEFEAALLEASAAIEEVGSGSPRWFRAPQGKLSKSMRGALQRHGMRHALGDCYCDDWGIEDPEFIAKTMLRQANSGSIAIMHMPERGFREHTLEAMRLFLEGLGERGIRCMTLTSLAELAEGQAPAANTM